MYFYTNTQLSTKHSFKHYFSLDNCDFFQVYNFYAQQRLQQTKRTYLTDKISRKCDFRHRKTCTSLLLRVCFSLSSLPISLKTPPNTDQCQCMSNYILKKLKFLLKKSFIELQSIITCGLPVFITFPFTSSFRSSLK